MCACGKCVSCVNAGIKTKAKQIARLHNLLKIANDLYLGHAISKTKWQTTLRGIDKQREAQNITWEQLEQYDKEAK